MVRWIFMLLPFHIFFFKYSKPHYKKFGILKKTCQSLLMLSSLISFHPMWLYYEYLAKQTNSTTTTYIDAYHFRLKYHKNILFIVYQTSLETLEAIWAYFLDGVFNRSWWDLFLKPRKYFQNIAQIRNEIKNYTTNFLKGRSF